MTQADAAIEQAARMIAKAQRIAVLTGAGISTDSEIPDYRGPQGVWTKNPAAEKASNINHYLADPEVRRAAWQTRLHSPIWDAEPNGGHRALLELERQNKLLMLVTQNVDGLHTKAGSNSDLTVEVHGSVRSVICMDCEYKAPMQQALDRVKAGEVEPECPDCSGILKSSTISFGQSLVEEDLMRAQSAAMECDLLLCVGSTLAVGPVNRMVPRASRHRAGIIIVNGGPTEMDEYADVIVHGSISKILPQIIGGPGPSPESPTSQV